MLEESFIESNPMPKVATIGKVQKEYSFNTSSTDLNGDEIYYFFDWGDGTNSSWLGPFESGEEVTAYHQWNDAAEYEIKVEAKDIYGSKSGWSESAVVQILTLKPKIISGFISEKIEIDEFITFKADLLIVFPSNYYIYYYGETIVVSKDHFGRIWPNFVVGVFNATILSESYTSGINPSDYRIFKSLYHNIKKTN